MGILCDSAHSIEVQGDPWGAQPMMGYSLYQPYRRRQG
jgi:hypothetical protein